MKIEDFEEWAYQRYARNTVIDSIRKIRYLSKKIDLESRESIMTFLRELRKEGILRSKIEISQYGGYYDSQRKLITETIKEEIYHVAKDRTITMESRLLPGDGRKILIKITGGGE